jgi:Uma2 family endonuclease
MPRRLSIASTDRPRRVGGNVTPSSDRRLQARVQCEQPVEEALMATIATVRGLTYDDLVFVPQEREGDRHELIDGVLYVTPSPVPAHERVSIRLTFWFGDAIRPTHSGELFTAPIDVKLGPTDVVVPDLVFVSRERLHIVGPKAIEGAPDLVVEILSPSTRRRDLGKKKALYERFGVPEYWTVDHKRRAVTVCVLRDGLYECLVHVDGILRSTTVPRLEVDLAALFAGL